MTAAARLLDERLARGEITPEEYRSRLDTLRSTTSMRRWKVSPLVVAVIALALVGTVAVAAGGLMSGGGLMHGMTDMGTMMGGGQPGRLAPEPPTGARELRVAATEFSFRPRDLRIAAGETVNVVFENRGAMFHTLTVGEQAYELRANGGESIAGALTIERPGVYSFICAVPGHAGSGMRGTLAVT
jgi:plastocyanin